MEASISASRDSDLDCLAAIDLVVGGDDYILNDSTPQSSDKNDKGTTAAALATIQRIRQEGVLRCQNRVTEPPGYEIADVQTRNVSGFAADMVTHGALLATTRCYLTCLWYLNILLSLLSLLRYSGRLLSIGWWNLLSMRKKKFTF